MRIELEVYEHSGRVLAVFVISGVLVSLIYSKAKHLNGPVSDKEILNKVGYKVEDLELKVNILTYKIQYGSWPLPHQIHKSNFRKNLRNLRLTLSNPNDRNEWIKHVLLSPRKNESYVTNSKYNYPSEIHLTELFDAKKKIMYPYLRRDPLPLEHSSKSSKSSSDRSLKLNSVFKTNRRQRKVSKSENFEVQSRDAMPPPFYSRKRNKSTSQINKDSKVFRTDNVTGSCKKFTKTMDECKRYLKELQDSNKNLGLVCSSSEISDTSSIKNNWSEAQQRTCAQQNLAKPNTKEANVKHERNLKGTNSKQRSKKNCLELSNAIYPILKLTDKCLGPSKMNITFCTEMFPGQSVSNMLISQSCEQKKFMESSQETLYQVKKKLDSLHNVLRTYEIQSTDEKVVERQQDSRNNINSICQNVMDTLVSVATEADNWNEKRKSGISFDTDSRKNYDEIQQTVYISSEQYESDETGISSDLSIQNYSNMFTTCCIRNINDLRCSLPTKSENKIYSLNNQKMDAVKDNRYCSNITYDKIPERVYYTISSNLFQEKDINREETVTENYKLPDIHTEDTQAKSFSFSDQHAVPMETDEDLIIMSPTSSRTEISKDSESEDKSTALLLQEALQFKQALLTRVELEKICHIDDKRKNINSESMSEYSKCSYVNNNFQSKFLDIISEEQSLSSSTDKTSRTYMFFNIKQDKQLTHSSTFNNNIMDFTHKNEIKDQNVCKGYLDSKQNLNSPSEYFSFNNIIHEGNVINTNKLSSSKHHHLQGNEPAEMVPSNLQIKYLNHTSCKSDEKLMEMKFANCLKNVEANINEQEICYNRVNKRDNSKTHFLRMNDINELITHNINSVELFSQNLNETLLDEENQNANKSEGCNFLDSESLKECTNVLSTKGTDNDLESRKLNLSDDEKYIEDNEILISSPNLSLKRHPGACSLIEQTLVTNTEKTAEMHTMMRNADALYELSASESKENSIETNLIQDSLTSSINHSNDSNIPEPPSVTVLINKSEELNLNWSNVKNNLSDDYVNEKNMQTISSNTITIEKYDYVDTESYGKQEQTCNEDTLMEKYTATEIHCDQDDEFKYEQNSSVVRNSFTDLGKENLINEADFCKSYSNLISPHSSLYFTDEASSSAKLRNACSKSFEDYLQTHTQNSNTQKSNKELHYQDENSKDIESADLLSISTSNESKKIITSTVVNTQKSYVKVSNKTQDIDQKLLESNNNKSNETDLFSSKNYVENADLSSFNKTEETLKTKNETLNAEDTTLQISIINHTLLSPKNINVSDKAQSSSLVSKTDILNVNQNMFLPNTSSHQISPRDTRKNITMNRINTTVKSRSQENYILKPEKLKKSVALKNVKGLKSDLLSTVHTKIENNTTPTPIKVRDLSVEPRRNTEYSVKLDKKRSQSQINFRSNESVKHITSRSYESPCNTNTINYTESLETKLELKGHVKPLLPTPKTSSRSCIPILKSRLEAARRSENESRPKSPVRGPLTMTMLWSDNLCSKSYNVMEKEIITAKGKSKNNEKCVEEINRCVKETNDNSNHTDKQDLMKASPTVQNISENIDSNFPPQEQMVIYVNIYTKCEQNTTKIVNPNKFLEYIENREVNVQKAIKENQFNKEVELSTDSMEKEKSTLHKIVTIVSSIINDNELNQNKSFDLSNAKLKHLCFFSVEQREIDVTAKPSVTDTSTSISDLEKTSETSKNALNKFRICGTPKELSNDEYITLLEILHQEPNTVHLQELRNICKKLISEHKKSK